MTATSCSLDIANNTSYLPIQPILEPPFLGSSPNPMKGQAFTVSCAEPTFLHTSDAQASCASNATGSSGCLRWSSAAPTGENPGPAHPVSLAQGSSRGWH